MENQLAKLENLFSSQITTLEDRGTPEQIVGLLIDQHDSVIQIASKIAFEDGYVPFLPVIPRTYRSPFDLMSMVKHHGKVGYSYLNPTEITDKVETPNEPYYIYDVEDGESTRNKSPKSVEKTFKSQKRLPLTVAEVMALTTHTNVLSRHNVFAVGSHYNSANLVHYVWLYDDKPVLSYRPEDPSSWNWGSPSLGRRE